MAKKKTEDKDIKKASKPKEDKLDWVDFIDYEEKTGKRHPEDPREALDGYDTGKPFFEKGDKTVADAIKEAKELAKKRKKFVGKKIAIAKGGSIPQQMELFQEGGLKDEGNTVDPVSGNDVPPGSMQEEVRDDIPAKLSEGEFVFPADVVRYIGLEKLMMMRQQAKAGLARMEEMGQMGNSEEATLPDDIPFTIDDLETEDEETPVNINEGGVVKMADGGSTSTQENKPNESTNITNVSNVDQPKPMAKQMQQLQPKLHERQAKVPVRDASVKTSYANIPSGADFMKASTTKNVATTNPVADATPKNIGERFLTPTYKKVQQQNAQDVQKEIDQMFSEDSEDNEDSQFSQGIPQAGVDYANTDRFALPEDARDVYNDFTKSQLSMFSIATASPWTAMASAVGMQFADKSKGMSVFGPMANAEKGKAKAKAFNTAMTDIMKEFNIPQGTPMHKWSKEAQAEIAPRGKIALNFGANLFNAMYNQPHENLISEEEKSFFETIKEKISNLFGEKITKPEQVARITQDPQKRKAYLDLIKTSVKQAQKIKQKEKDLQNANSMGIETTSVGNMYKLHNFDSGAEEKIAANGGSKGIRFNDNGQAYSVNNNGTFTHTDGTTVNFTDSKGNPGNAPKTETKPEPKPDYSSNQQSDDDNDSGLDSSSESYDSSGGGWT